MPILRAQVQFPFFTGIPRDVISNTLHFEQTTGTLADGATEIASRLTTFFSGVYDGGTFMADYVVWANGTVEVTDLSGPPPRIPEVRNVIPTGSPASSSVVPTEVACVLTFAAAETGGVVRQRLYNRIYIGALANACMNPGSASSFPTFMGTFRDRVGNAANALLLENDGDIDWIQYSPTAAIARPIARGWVDNSPDTQRRRSVDASARTTWLP